MANTASLEPVTYDSDQTNPNMNLSEVDSLPLPPLDFDFDFFSDDLSFPEDLMIELGFDNDFHNSLDDLPILNGHGDCFVGDSSQVFSSSSVSVDQDLTGVPSPCQNSEFCNVSGDLCGSTFSSQISADRSSYVDKFLNSPSPDSGSCERKCSRAVSSQDSGSCGSGFKRVVRSPSPDSGCCEREFSGSATSSSDSGKISSHSHDIPDQIIKSEEDRRGWLTKRKQEKDDENKNPRNGKFRKSTPSNNANPPYAFNSGNGEDDKTKSRLMRNRESAQLSRQRKKHYVGELEDKVRSMHSTITDLNSKISYIMAENASLRQHLGGGGAFPPPPGIYPPPAMAPMPYPWVPCASYAMRPQGSQVPLVPIPKLKLQQPLSTSKVKKPDRKTKKVASVSFLGMLFFILLFGGLVPFVNLRYGLSRNTFLNGSDLSDNGLNVQSRGRVLSVSEHVNRTNQSVRVGLLTENSSFKNGVTKNVHCERGRTEGAESEVEKNEQRQLSSPGTDWVVHVGNASEPLVASLHVPRNDKLVRIDGNLIIHSVLASEKALASSHSETGSKKDIPTATSLREVKGTGLAIPGNMVPALVANRHPHLFRSQDEQQKALTSSSEDTHKDTLKSSEADGSLQQWFHDGLAGPMLSSGLCTEVFQFNISPTSTNPGAIIPATSNSNISAEGPTHSSQHRRNRRILDHLAIPLPGPTFNKTEEHVGGTSQNDNFHGNKSVSSMVVSILVDPRDNEGDGVTSPRSLPRIFVVVLLDSVKYVTYSCVLPLKRI